MKIKVEKSAFTDSYSKNDKFRKEDAKLSISFRFDVSLRQVL